MNEEGRRSKARQRERVKIYRHGYPPVFPLFIAGCWIVIAVAILIFMPLSLWTLVIIPPHLAIAAFLWRTSRVGARLEQDGVRIVRMLRTARIPWSQFRRFVVRPKTRGELVPIDKAGYAERTDGSLEWIQGLGPYGPFIKHDEFAVEALVIEMNRRADDLKARQSPEPSR